MKAWPHQVDGLNQIRAAIEAGHRRIIYTLPTGGGKSQTIRDAATQLGDTAFVIVNRNMLGEQTALGMDAAGIDFGMHASGYAMEPWANVTVGSIQSAYKWWKEGRHDLPPADIVILDECHAETGPRSVEVIDEYVDERNAVALLVTATPIDVGCFGATAIVQPCQASYLREQNILVRASIHAPDEPDSRALKTTAKAVMELRDEYKEVMLPVIYGRVKEHFQKLNPDWKPTILFAPGVQESIWFCDKFNRAGVPFSHIDANRVIINGVEMPANRENRMALLEASKARKTIGISNRFVLREGIDVPWLEHGIFACTFGSLCGYIQSGGRLLRQYFVDGKPQLDKVTVADHGGNFWRYDSLNADRLWTLEDTEKALKERHDEGARNNPETQPIVCPQCSAVRKQGAVCPKCGFAYKGRKRMVIQTDGTLREVRGDIYKPRKVATPEDALLKAWKACVYRCKAKGRTFAQAKGLFARENNWQVPGEGFPLVPKFASDWALPVGDVPYERLSK